MITTVLQGKVSVLKNVKNVIGSLQALFTHTNRRKTWGDQQKSSGLWPRQSYD